MSDLFEINDAAREEHLPLSRRMMPKNLDEFRGQKHLLAKGKPIATMLENGILHSMIFYGPPATGKTSLAADHREQPRGAVRVDERIDA